MKILIFGIGTLYGVAKQANLFEKDEILAFVDNDESKQSTLFENKPVISPQSISEYSFEKIIITILDYDKVYFQLISLGIDAEKIFCYAKGNIISVQEQYQKFQSLKYNIISIGTYCLPRFITTLAEIKPKKCFGELTLPFDLVIHYNIREIIKLLETDFRDYFNDLEWDEKRINWTNNSVQVYYIHDRKLKKEEFIKTYQQRIENFRTYCKSDKHAFFILSTFYNGMQITENEIKDLYNALLKTRGERAFSLIIINHAAPISNPHDNICIINQPFTLTSKWHDELSTEEGKLFYNNIVKRINNFIREKI